MSKSIEINYLGDSGYEVLYPNTMLNSVLDWQENLYSKDEILDSATKALYGLGTDAVPDDVLEKLSNAVFIVNNSFQNSVGGNITIPSAQLDQKTQIKTGSYVGTGTYGRGNKTSLSFSFQPKIVFVFCENYYKRDNTYYDYPAIFIFGIDYAATSNTGNGGCNQVVVSWSGNNVSWYSEDTGDIRAPARQLNMTGQVYRYVAIS